MMSPKLFGEPAAERFEGPAVARGDRCRRAVDDCGNLAEGEAGVNLQFDQLAVVGIQSCKRSRDRFGVVGILVR